MVEHWSEKPGVDSSILSLATTILTANLKPRISPPLRLWRARRRLSGGKPKNFLRFEVIDLRFEVAVLTVLAGVAQLVEHLFRKQVVVGSSPILGSLFVL